MSSLNGLSLKDNVILQGLSLPEKDQVVWSRDLGYNKMQQLTDFFTRNAGGSKAYMQKRFDTYSVGNTSISAIIAIPSTVSGALLTVTITPGGNSGNYREGDIVLDNNGVPGRIAQVVSDNIFKMTLSDPTIGSWNASTHFTQGMYAGVSHNAMLSRGSRGRKPLQVFPEGDYNYIQTLRESAVTYIDDGIQSFVRVKGKSWYTTNQMLTLERLSRQIENWHFWSPRNAEGLGTNSEILQTGTIRWSIINQGGTYNVLGSALSIQSINDTLVEMARKSTSASTELFGFVGRQALADLQTLTFNNIIYAGTQNTFGGATVQGWNVMKYVFAGVTLNYVHWPLLDDPNLMGNVPSTITGKPKWSSSILLCDMSLLPSVGAERNVPPIMKCHFKAAGEYTAKYLPGMMDMNQALGNDAGIISPQGDSSLAVSDLDAVAMEMYASMGLRILPEKWGLIELAN